MMLVSGLVIFAFLADILWMLACRRFEKKS